MSDVDLDRARFLELGADDAGRLAELGAAIGGARARLVGRFYDHLRAFPDTRDLLTSPETLARLQRAQAAYFDRLLAGDYGADYLRDRAQVGIAHHRIGLEPRWYLGAYCLYLRELLPAVRDATGGDWARAVPALEALLKVVFLDVSIAIDAYRDADRRHIVELKEQYERVVESVPAGLVVVGRDLELLAANRSFLSSCGCALDELRGRAIADVLGAPALVTVLADVLATGEPRAAIALIARCRGTGRERPVRIAVTPLQPGDGDARLLVVVNDLTQEEQLAAVARASEQRFREVVEHATDGIVVAGRDGGIATFNAAAERMFGWRRDEVIGEPVTVLVPPEACADHERGVAAVLDGASPSDAPRELVARRRDGTRFPVECTLSAFRSNGDVTLIGVLRDISERRRAEEALRRSEASFRALIEQSPDAIAVQRNGVLVYANAATAAYLGYAQPDDLVGRAVLELVHPDDRAIVAERIRAIGRSGAALPPREQRCLRRDGAAVTAEVIALPLTFDGEPAVVIVARDVTERNELTAKMMRMDRMIAVGTLAAGVGHEINNPLTYVMLNLDLVALELEALREHAGAPLPLDRLRELQALIDEARNGTARVRDIVRDLKSMSRADEPLPRAVTLTPVIEAATRMAWGEIRHRARLVKDLGPAPMVAADESRLVQVVLNLLVNAAHAIPGGNAQQHEVRVATRTAPDGRAEIEVADTGGGMPPEVLARVFDPFFTTKPVGQGTGLGLTICDAIVRALGGEIAIDSELGAGTRVRILLPATRADPARKSDDAVPAATRRARILVVDDELIVAEALRRALEPEHDVVAVARGADALDLLAAGRRFDLVLCDLMMPEVTGIEVHAEVARRFPEMLPRLVFMTGGAFTPEAREFLARVETPRLEKPIDLRGVRTFVRRFVR